MAYTVAAWSKDPETKVGALLVSPCKTKFSWGYNGFPRGVEDTEERLYDREEKLALTVHAELNCILNATDTEGWTLYCTKPPCLSCAVAIIQAGIKRVVCTPLTEESSWFCNQNKAKNLLIEAHTVVIETQF